MNIEFRIDGLSSLLARLKAAPTRAHEAAGRALYEEGQEIMAESKAIVPFKDGGLRGSGVVDPPHPQPFGIEVALGYGGPAIPYAVYQHERLDLQHSEGRTAKYLEKPVLAAMPRMTGRLKIRLARILARA